MIARSDCFKAYSLRPLATETTPITTTRGVADCTHGRYASQIPNGAHYPTFNYVSYDFSGDTDAQKQDALKVRIPVFAAADYFLADSKDDTTNATITQAIDDAQTEFTIDRGGQSFELEGSWLVGSEIMTLTAFDSSTSTATVLRNQFGTTAASHTPGTEIRRATNSLPDARRTLPLDTDGSVSATYLLTWDTYWTDSFVNQGLVAHKLNQITSHDFGQQLIEYKPIYQGNTNPSFVAANDVAALTIRWYSQSLTAGFFQEPGAPIRDENNEPTYGFLIRPNTWTRVWMLVEANAETDTTKFVSSGQTLVSAGGIDASTTDITISHDLGSGVWYLGGETRTNETNPFTSEAGVVSGATWPGRRIKVGDEVMTIVSGTDSGDTRVLTVLRGQDGTAQASHAFGEAIQVIDDHVTVWMADENNDPRMIVNRVSLFLPIDNETANRRGSLGAFWIEFNTSQQQLGLGRAASLTNARGGDLVAYQRNLVVLKDPPSDWSALRVAPVP